jgi:hypothetical protein
MCWLGMSTKRVSGRAEDLLEQQVGLVDARPVAKGQ